MLTMSITYQSYPPLFHTAEIFVLFRNRNVRYARRPARDYQLSDTGFYMPNWERAFFALTLRKRHAPTALEQCGAVASWILDGGLALQSELISDILKLTAAWLRGLSLPPSYKIVNMPLSL